MGYYIETPVTTRKADWLLVNVPGTIEVQPTGIPRVPIFDTTGEKVLVFVAENGSFDAAAVAYNEKERERFLRGGVGRRVRYLHVPKKYVLEQLPMLKDLLG